MNRIKYEQYHGASGYDALARKKIKELEEKVGGGGGSGGAVVFSVHQDGTTATCSHSFEEAFDLISNGKAPVIVSIALQDDLGSITNSVYSFWYKGEADNSFILMRFDWIEPMGNGTALNADATIGYNADGSIVVNLYG